MDRATITLLCRCCPHSRFVGGEPPDWRVQLCLFSIDNAEPKKRNTTPAEDLRELAECPDVPRRVRLTGGA